MTRPDQENHCHWHQYLLSPLCCVQVMRIQARYWACMRALGQQQLKLLAATAARQEHLAAMKLRRQQAAAADMAAAQAELGLPLGLGADGLEDGLEGEADEEVGGHLHGSRARPHFRLGRMDGMEEVEADTPHRGEAAFLHRPRTRLTSLAAWLAATALSSLIMSSQVKCSIGCRADLLRAVSIGPSL
jgi:hypothetical protein